MKLNLASLKAVGVAIVVALQIAASAIVFTPATAAAAVIPKTAQIYGDSITYESWWAIKQQFALKKGWTARLHAYGGTAPCDWLEWLPTDLATYQPSVVSIETAVNTGTPCMQDANGVNLAPGSQALHDKYRADLNSFFAQVTVTGAKVVFIKAPPMQDATKNSDIDWVNNLVATELAGLYHGISIAPSPRTSVSGTGGKYVEYKTCLATETAAQGCLSSGKIAIRTITNLDKGIHLCPTGLFGLTPPGICPTYSSGEYRFGKATANTIVNPPKPVLL